MRSGPNKNARRVGALEAGELVRIIEKNRSWALVEARNGLRGWVYDRFLEREILSAAAD